MHELVHYVTYNALKEYELKKDYDNNVHLSDEDEPHWKLNAEQLEACETLHSVFKQLQKDKDFQDEYGLTNVYEMVAELSNVDFRQKLKRKNLWVRIVDSIAKIVRVFKKGYKAASALEAAEGALYRLIDSFGGEDEEAKDGQHSEAFPLELKEKPLAFKVERAGKHGSKELAFDVDNIPDAEFENPTKDFELKPLSDRFFEATKTQKKPLLLKQNILLKNKTHHPEIKSIKDSKRILSQALYGNNVVMLCKPKDKPNYWSVVKEGSEYYVSVIDTDPAKKYNEIVGWRKIDKKKYIAMKRRVREEDGQLLITEEIKDFSSRAADLSALPPDKQSISHPTKKSSEFPRFMVKKSVARRVLLAPLPRLAFTKSGRLVVRR